MLSVELHSPTAQHYTFILSFSVAHLLSMSCSGRPVSLVLDLGNKAFEREVFLA